MTFAASPGLGQRVHFPGKVDPVPVWPDGETNGLEVELVDSRQ